MFNYGKNNKLIWTGYSGGSGAEPAEGRKFFTKFVKIGNRKLKKLITFQKMHEFFERVWTKL